MIFELGDGRLIEHPNWEEILDNLKEVGSPDASVAVLSRSELSYIQTQGNDKDGFEIEYQEENESNHWVTIDRNLPRSRVIEVFQSYFEDKEDWKNWFSWRRG
jgi:hypothetical protein